MLSLRADEPSKAGTWLGSVGVTRESFDFIPCDLAKIHRVRTQNVDKISLSAILAHYGIARKHLHNAGSDAVYALIAGLAELRIALDGEIIETLGAWRSFRSSGKQALLERHHAKPAVRAELDVGSQHSLRSGAVIWIAYTSRTAGSTDPSKTAKEIGSVYA